MVAIEIKKISKKYTITSNIGRYISFREKIGEMVKSIFSFKKNNINVFWALKNVSVDIEKGSVVGIIGDNGAGKSTLLKILSRITLPTEGEVNIRGSVVSLLEVGTGFNQELTGRENIYLNSAILGMSKKEVDQKMESIVEFSGIREFLDMPVKKYSSGMYVRLAFAIAANIDSDILLVDEILAVGDADFQKKCLNKMSSITKEKNRTILFVSHDMGAVQNLCTECILLKEGRIKMIGDTDKVVGEYLNHHARAENNNLEHRRDRIGNGNIIFTELFCMNSERKRINTLVSGEEVYFVFKYKKRKFEKSDKVFVYIGINTIQGNRIVTLSNKYTGNVLDCSNGEILCRIPRLPLIKGEYFMGITLKINNETADNIVNAGSFSVVNGKFYKFEYYDLSQPGRGHFAIDHSWEEDIVE
jgi:lipopolysaccharide transport system ATP-binding protein